MNLEILGPLELSFSFKKLKKKYAIAIFILKNLNYSLLMKYIVHMTDVTNCVQKFDTFLKVKFNFSMVCLLSSSVPLFY